ncbi:MAG: DUF1844 domain-containing protein [Phycisphaerales bacterium]|nr:DUF1844 domain-containing protein [Phycisphaerales bacterium]
MSDQKRILVDDDWKAQAQAEKERLAEQTAQQEAGPAPAPQFAEILDLIVMQAAAGLGLMRGHGGERIPPNLEVAKHFIDLIQVLEDKTKGNLTPDEKKMMDGVLYEMRMRYVQVAGALTGVGTPGAGPAKP